MQHAVAKLVMHVSCSPGEAAQYALQQARQPGSIHVASRNALCWWLGVQGVCVCVACLGMTDWLAKGK
jgi:hypothetical protein